jgi:hypothetical protein
MNTWGYLLLIAALLLLAGVMLYARFASRSREKSLHHAPVDWEFSPMVISSAPAPTEEIPLVSAEFSTPEAKPVLRLERTTAPAAATEPSRGRDYMDDLQEAAAGLAKLMRSSPVARVEPVVFAPEEVVEEPVEEFAAAAETTEEEVFVALVEEPVIESEILPVEAEETFVFEEEPAFEEAEIVAEEVSLDVVVEEAPLEVVAEIEEVVELVELIAELPIDEVVAETPVIEEPVAIEEEIVAEESPVAIEEPVAAEIHEEVEAPRILSFRELLGDAVADQFDRIDEGLDALESLVIGIESSLRALADLERGDLDGDHHEDEDAIAAAA